MACIWCGLKGLSEGRSDKAKQSKALPAPGTLGARSLIQEGDRDELQITMHVCA